MLIFLPFIVRTFKSPPSKDAFDMGLGLTGHPLDVRPLEAGCIAEDS